MNLGTVKWAQWDKTKPNPENCKNCSSKCAYDCATSVHNTAQNSSDNLPSYLQTTIAAQMLSMRGKGKTISSDYNRPINTVSTIAHRKVQSSDAGRSLRKNLIYLGSLDLTLRNKRLMVCLSWGMAHRKVSSYVHEWYTLTVLYLYVRSRVMLQTVATELLFKQCMRYLNGEQQ